VFYDRNALAVYLVLLPLILIRQGLDFAMGELCRKWKWMGSTWSVALIGVARVCDSGLFDTD
jgi:hypothetical protein